MREFCLISRSLVVPLASSLVLNLGVVVWAHQDSYRTTAVGRGVGGYTEEVAPRETSAQSFCADIKKTCELEVALKF